MRDSLFAELPFPVLRSSSFTFHTCLEVELPDPPAANNLYEDMVRLICPMCSKQVGWVGPKGSKKPSCSVHGFVSPHRQVIGRKLSKKAKQWKEAAALVLNLKWKRLSSKGPLLMDTDLTQFRWALRLTGQWSNIYTSAGAKEPVLKRDVDGQVKLPMDTVLEYLGIDDRYVFDLIAHKGHGPDVILVEIGFLEEVR